MERFYIIHIVRQNNQNKSLAFPKNSLILILVWYSLKANFAISFLLIMLNEPWVPIYLFIVVSLSLVPIVLICTCLIRVCIFEMEERADDIREDHKANVQKFTRDSSMLARAPLTAAV